MRTAPHDDAVSLDELAAAAEVPPDQLEWLAARGALRTIDAGTTVRFVAFDEAVRVVRALRQGALTPAPGLSGPLLFRRVPNSRRGGGAALGSMAAHAAVAGLLAAMSVPPPAPAAAVEDRGSSVHLVFLASAGLGGGGGGGGRLQPAPASAAERRGSHAPRSPVPAREIVARPEPRQPEPPAALLESSLLAPVASAPPDARDRDGVIESPRTFDDDSAGPGRDGGAGGMAGRGLDSGSGPGIGDGEGGGAGGGVYRAGSGVEPPRLLREVRAGYTEEARRAGIQGEVLLDIVVRRDGTVGDVRVRRGLGGGLTEQAIEAVRRWWFLPATRRGTPVDVLVEVAVEFRLR